VTDALTDFARRNIEFDGLEYEVFVAGEGPAVLVLPEIPGITPDVADFGRRLVDQGFTVWVPSLFGTPGRPMTESYVMSTLAKSCVNKTFLAFARGKRAPIIDYLRQLGELAHAECGGPGIGVVGMCFTGNFALALAIDDIVKVPVMSQPSLPLTPSKNHRRDLHVAPDDLDTIKLRMAEQELCVIGLRFTNDPFVPAARFETLRREFGEAFIGVEIDSSKGNSYNFGTRTHSVLSTEYSPESGHPTNDAFHLVLDHLREKLLP
jgi:dienelactone hydrolase